MSFHSLPALHSCTPGTIMVTCTGTEPFRPELEWTSNRKHVGNTDRTDQQNAARLTISSPMWSWPVAVSLSFCLCLYFLNWINWMWTGPAQGIGKLCGRLGPPGHQGAPNRVLNFFHIFFLANLKHHIYFNVEVCTQKKQQLQCFWCQRLSHLWSHCNVEN